MPVDMDADAKLLKKFEKIEEAWRDRVGAMGVDELKAMVVEVTKNEAQNQEVKEMDEDLQRAKAEYDTANLGYKEATTINKLKVKFTLRHLKAKGG